MDYATYVPFVLADEARHYYQSIASDAEVMRAIAAECESIAAQDAYEACEAPARAAYRAGSR